MKSISLIICAFNEETSLEKSVSDCHTALKKIRCEFEIIIVNDGSTDDTKKIADKLTHQYPEIRALHLSHNKGIGSALKYGFNQAKCDLLTFFPADGQLSPSIIQLMFNEINSCDAVTTIYNKRGDALLRIFLSKLCRYFIFILFGPTSPIEGTYLIKRKDYTKMNIISQTFIMNFEIIIRLSKWGRKISTLQITCLPRENDTSKVFRFKRLSQASSELIKFRLKSLKGY